MKIKAGGKAIIAVLIAAGVYFGGSYAMNKATEKGILGKTPGVAAGVPEMSMDIPTAGASQSALSKIDLQPADSSKPVKLLTIPWNGTSGLQYANGAPTTAKGSLMDQHGVNLTIERQDDYSQMVASMAAFAKEFKDGNPNPSNGAPFVIIMGDALPSFIQSANTALNPFGQTAKAIAQIGFSRGEDKCMLPPAAKTNPQAARGMTVAGVERDGDLHICFKWAKDNQVPINSDSKTYDADALNIMAVDSFDKGDEKFIARYCEQRPVVKAGKPTGSTHNTCTDGTATWTPGDVNVAQKRGGIVSVASTKEYSYQMPTLIIGNAQWMEKNARLVENLLAASFTGSEAVLNSDAALDKAAQVLTQVTKQENAAYWKKYFKGVTEPDATGMQVQLGGSTVSGLADNEFYFGLNGKDNIFKKVYTVYGNIDSFYYPNDLPKVLPYEQAVDMRYLTSLLSKAKTMAPVNTPTYSNVAKVKDVVSKAVWKIEFQTGSAAFTAATQATLEDLLNQISAGGMSIQIKGYTDNVGNDEINLALSSKRAQAVKAWITANAPTSFPAERVKATGYGSASPIEDNATATGRAKNRRVEILQVTTE